MSAHIIVGMGFGDEGKGVMTNYLAVQNQAQWVIRYNGGPQAAHTVMFNDTKSSKFGNVRHTFSQFGSGTFAGVRTYLSKHMMVNPISLIDEWKKLNHLDKSIKLDMVHIDPLAPMITPYHIYANRICERILRHGSCGMGISQLAKDLINHPENVIRMKDLKSTDLVERLETIRLSIVEEMKARSFYMGDEPLLSDKLESFKMALAYQKMAKHLNILSNSYDGMTKNDRFIFEGAQGILLDEWHGFHPNTTWSNTTQENALSILKEIGFDKKPSVIGVTRAYITRHGAGPFVNRDYQKKSYEYNTANEWQGKFKYGYIDGVMLDYSSKCIKDHGEYFSFNLAVTHVDEIYNQEQLACDVYEVDGQNQLIRYESDHNLQRQENLGTLIKRAKPMGVYKIDNSVQLLNFIEEHTESKVKYVSYGPMFGDQFSVS